MTKFRNLVTCLVLNAMPHLEEEFSEKEEGESQVIVLQPEAQGGVEAPTDGVSEASQVQEAEEQLAT